MKVENRAVSGGALRRVLSYALGGLVVPAFVLGCAATAAPGGEDYGSRGDKYVGGKCLGNGICDQSGNPEGPGPQDCQGDKCAPNANDEAPGYQLASDDSNGGSGDDSAGSGDDGSGDGWGDDGSGDDSGDGDWW